VLLSYWRNCMCSNPYSKMGICDQMKKRLTVRAADTATPWGNVGGFRRRRVANSGHGRHRRAADAIVGRIWWEERNARLCEVGLRRGQRPRGGVAAVGRGYSLGSRCGGRRGTLAWGAPAAAPEGGWRGRLRRASVSRGCGGDALCSAARGPRGQAFGTPQATSGRKGCALSVRCGLPWRREGRGPSRGFPCRRGQGSCAKASPMLNWKQRKGGALVPPPRAAVGRPRVPMAGLRCVGSDFRRRGRFWSWLQGVGLRPTRRAADTASPWGNVGGLEAR